MKKPNKLYRKLGGKRSLAGSAFAAVRHPKRSLRQAFGRDFVARDAAENLDVMEPSKKGFQMVFAILAKWNKPYKGKVHGLFSLLSHKPRPVVPPTHRPQID